MKNLDESRKREDASQGEVIAIKSRDARPEGPQPLLPQQQIDLCASNGPRFRRRLSMSLGAL